MRYVLLFSIILFCCYPISHAQQMDQMERVHRDRMAAKDVSEKSSMSSKDYIRFDKLGREKPNYEKMLDLGRDIDGKKQTGGGGTKDEGQTGGGGAKEAREPRERPSDR